MPAPVVDEIPGGLQFQFPDYHITVSLDRFRESAYGGLTAEMVATTNAPGYAPHLTQGQLSLTSIRARADLAKRLSKLYDQAQWDAVLEMCCAEAIRRRRKGEPILRLAASAQVEPTGFLLEPLVRGKASTILYGPGGIGKSLFALFAGMAVEAGADLAGLESVKGAVALLDYESEYGDHVERAKKFRRGRD